MSPVNHHIRGYYLTSYIGLVILLVLYFLLAIVLAPPPDPYGPYDQPPDPPVVAICVLFLMFPLSLVMIGSAMRWLYDAWSSIPEEHRQVPLFGTVSPGMVVGLFFIPCFNYFWMFVVNIGLGASIDRSLTARGLSARTSNGLAVAACCVQLLPYCNFLFAPILWFLWMRDVDRARERLTEFDAGAVADVFS